jgi:hypothetical protein
VEEAVTDIPTHLRIAGILLIALAAAHPFFPARFGWKEDLASAAFQK